MKVEDIFQGLKEVANPEDAIHMKAYMKDQFEFLGVKTPVRRKLSKVFFKKNSSLAIDWKFIHQAWDNPYREMQYVVLDYLQLKQKALTPSDLPKIKKLAQTKPWWDTIDFLCRSVGFICLHYPETKKFVLEWSRDEDFWLRRIAIEHQLLQKEETDVQLLEQILINNLNQTEFFINKAIGWALRDYSKTNPDWVLEFIEKYKDKLSKLSIKEGSKYL
ncbi:MAG: DNA alkylation repair protein [Streptococcus mutans]|uniref:DNA alkylation repair protein n=1 Tax=Streptococcus anginosus TaxID=1328 RepID=A0ABD4U543_STRAP|nr:MULTISPECIES: DNA alkylation repair protein [Streptococcus]KAA9295882.1 DNA alkylation repair protein [Streptococcus anginosus]KUM01581.1 DNA alkylation repair protein [Streptococcus anginosus]MCW1077224.1 DNA alkylation repair protein [Streptococcus anginosus]MDB8656336.1 DNA alkylation repair protein [Streptococcus anginosus]MDB8659851.1 DNA alkylation repair protein [Streptococcus anginosus]